MSYRTTTTLPDGKVLTDTFEDGMDAMRSASRQVYVTGTDFWYRVDQLKEFGRTLFIGDVRVLVEEVK